MTPDAAATSDRRYAAFRHGAFLRFWMARFLATFATQIVSVAVGWQVYDLTRDPFDLGLVGIVQFLPALLLVLVTGEFTSMQSVQAFRNVASWIWNASADRAYGSTTWRWR